jgi:hypothetical protein
MGVLPEPSEVSSPGWWLTAAFLFATQLQSVPLKPGLSSWDFLLGLINQQCGQTLKLISALTPLMLPLCSK